MNALSAKPPAVQDPAHLGMQLAEGDVDEAQVRGEDGDSRFGCHGGRGMGEVCRETKAGVVRRGGRWRRLAWRGDAK